MHFINNGYLFRNVFTSFDYRPFPKCIETKNYSLVVNGIYLAEKTLDYRSIRKVID